jgi:hypothetical protein
MGHKIVYCSDCGKSILESEFEKGRASTVADRPYCGDCRPPCPPEAEKPSSTRLTPPSQRKIATARIPVSPSTTRRTGKPASKLPLVLGGSVVAAGVLLLLAAGLSSGSRPAAPTPPPETKPAAKAPEPPRPAAPRAPASRDPAAAADVERAMREEAERAKAGKLDEFLAGIRKMSDENPIARRSEIESMLDSAGRSAGARIGEVEKVRAEYRVKLDEALRRATFVARWKLDEMTGTAVTDASGGRAGTLEGGPAWTTGRLGGGLALDGKDDGVRVTAIEGLSPQAEPDGEMTLAGWVRISERPPAAGQGRVPIACKGELRGYEYAIYVYADGRAGFCLWTLDGQGHAEVAGGSIALDRWHHVAGVYKKGRFARLYLDGAPVNELTTFNGALAAGPAPFFIGRRGDGQFLKGAVDDVRLYRRVLSDAELKALAEGKE